MERFQVGPYGFSALKEHAMVWHLSVIELLELRDGALTEKKSRRLKCTSKPAVPVVRNQVKSRKVFVNPPQ
jgi:hypothetical protein